MLISGVAKHIQSGGQRTVKVSVRHERGDFIAHAVTLISKESQAPRSEALNQRAHFHFF